MAQFDLLRNPRRGAYPLLVDLQADLLARLETRTVAPLITVKRYGARPITRLNPVVTVDGAAYVVVVQELAAVPRSGLGAVVGTLASRRADLVAALDLLFTGA
ncbi:MAG: CcdB family protein [Myxococcales bacterium]|nr:CcdB family protein [Myxococcales bacterium]